MLEKTVAAENERGKLDAAKKAEKRDLGSGIRDQEKPVQAPVAAPAPAKSEDRENVLSLIDQLSDETQAK